MPASTTAILFDLDGTLIDTAPDFHRVLNLQRKRHGLPDLEYSAVRRTVSDGARALIRLSFGIAPDDLGFNELRQELLDLYLEDIAVESKLFDGFEKVLNALEEAKIPWGIVTNKPRLYSEALLSQMNLEQRLGILVCPDDVSLTKPHPEPLLKAADHLQRESSKCWYVGDHQRDIEAGRRARMTTVAAAYGYVPGQEDVRDWQADYIVDKPQDLIPLIFSP